MQTSPGYFASAESTVDLTAPRGEKLVEAQLRVTPDTSATAPAVEGVEFYLFVPKQDVASGDCVYVSDNTTFVDTMDRTTAVNNYCYLRAQLLNARDHSPYVNSAFSEGTPTHPYATLIAVGVHPVADRTSASAVMLGLGVGGIQISARDAHIGNLGAVILGRPTG